jgi:hypothetical protein
VWGQFEKDLSIATKIKLIKIKMESWSFSLHKDTAKCICKYQLFIIF